MSATVRVRCAVGRNGEDVAVLGFLNTDDDEVPSWLHDWDFRDLFWITVEIPLPVEPVVVAEVE